MEKEIHSWLKEIHIYHHQATETPLIQEVMEKLLASFEAHGHVLQDEPDEDTDVLLTTARYGELISWRRALMFTGRIRYKLSHTPRTVTLVHITPDEYNDILAHFEQALAKEPFDRSEFTYEGLADAAPDVLVEQGRRGGPMLSLIRLLQSQLKCIRILLLVGDDKPEKVYHIDLVGAHPYTDYKLGEDLFYEDIVLRTATYESTYEVTKHEVVGDLIPEDVWDELPTVAAMTRAGQEMGKRKFFTDMLRIVDLVPVPGLNDAIADQYSEGCFATWEPHLPALIATVTGSARPVDKGNITPDDLAAITGIRPNRMGAQVRHVEGGENISPSSEAVELIDMDTVLHKIDLPGFDEKVPVVRSKLHGHRGVAAFDPEHVEYVPMDSPYHNYLVSCATEAQARGIKAAFGRANSLENPDDPRRVAFTVLPGHGIVITEKWANGKQPFELIWEYMDAGYLKIDRLVPQGMFMYDRDHDGLMKIIKN